MSNATTHHNYRQARHRHASPLWWFVSLSLLLHAGLLWYWQHPVTSVAPRNSSGMAVHLVERQQQKAVAEKRPSPQPAKTAAHPVQAPSPHPLPQLISGKPETRQAANARAEPSVPTQAEAPTGADKQATDLIASDEEEMQSSLKVTLEQELARHFSYPLLARRRGWQGEVLLAFRLEADGRIIDARVSRSSGYSVLDRAALTALGKIKRIETKTPRGFAMQLPVIYRLEG